MHFFIYYFQFKIFNIKLINFVKFYINHLSIISTYYSIKSLIVEQHFITFNKNYLFFKTEGEGSGIKIAVSDHLTKGYVLHDKYVHQTKDPVEGAGTFKLNDGSGYILMYDVYTKGKYQFTKTSDLKNFTVVDNDVTMDFHPRHGTVIPITAKEAARLAAKWMLPVDAMLPGNSNTNLK